jgi:glycosyltransferase involved in cell wall biosynthesis
VASLVSLEAFAKLCDERAYYIIMGGDQKHREYCERLKIKNVRFLPRESEASKIQAFLDCIDAYAHCRNDGEVCSACLIEALAHGLPIITHRGSGPNFGHLEQTGDVGGIAENVGEYCELMRRLLDKDYRRANSEKAAKKYAEIYKYDAVAQLLSDLL